MMPITRLKKMIDEVNGTVTWRSLCHQVAPSTSAASYRCCGTPWSPARKISTELPTAQRRTTTTEGTVHAEPEQEQAEDGGKDEHAAPGRLPPPEPDHCWAGSPVSRIFWITVLSSGAISLNVFLPRRTGSSRGAPASWTN